MKNIIMYPIQMKTWTCVALTNRYMSDRHLPDKAIDALDEAGSRVHINNINVPENILKLEKELDVIKSQKGNVIKTTF